MKQKKSSLTIRLLCLTIIPLLLAIIVMAVINVRTTDSAVRKEIENGLGSLGHALYMIYDGIEGNYVMKDGILKKGTTTITGNYEIVDKIKQESGIDATLFYGNTRIVTSILRKDGTRAVGTQAVQEVTEQVLKQGRNYFSPRVSVNEIDYFGYYQPVFHQDGQPVGMVFVGKPRPEVMSTIESMVSRTILISTALLVIVSILCIYNARSIIRLIKSAICFLGEISQGNVHAEFDPMLLKRNDEIGELGKFSVLLQSSMIELIGTDPLTGLYNRRSGTITLENLCNECEIKGGTFSAAIGDIDSFKRINDKYGHSGGDQVLKKLAAIFIDHMENKGFVARWGGEEFIFVFEKTSRLKAHAYLDELLEKIRGMEVLYNQETIQLTMTFGLAEFQKGESLDQLITKADENLYLGKRNKKNQVVS